MYTAYSIAVRVTVQQPCSFVPRFALDFVASVEFLLGRHDLVDGTFERFTYIRKSDRSEVWKWLKAKTRHRDSNFFERLL